MRFAEGESSRRLNSWAKERKLEEARREKGAKVGRSGMISKDSNVPRNSGDLVDDSEACGGQTTDREYRRVCRQRMSEWRVDQAVAGPREHGFRRTGKSDIRRGPSWRGGEELVGEGSGRKKEEIVGDRRTSQVQGQGTLFSNSQYIFLTLRQSMRPNKFSTLRPFRAGDFKSQRWKKSISKLASFYGKPCFERFLTLELLPTTKK